MIFLGSINYLEGSAAPTFFSSYSLAGACPASKTEVHKALPRPRDLTRKSNYYAGQGWLLPALKRRLHLPKDKSLTDGTLR